MRNAQLIYFYLVQKIVSRRKEVLAGHPSTTSPRIRYSPPYIGPQGLLRATCRTKQLAVYNFDAKHPILLDSCHPHRTFVSRIAPRTTLPSGCSLLEDVDAATGRHRQE